MIAVTKRRVYQSFGGRTRTVYDAEGVQDGVEYYVCGAASKAEAQLLAACSGNGSRARYSARRANRAERQAVRSQLRIYTRED